MAPDVHRNPLGAPIGRSWDALGANLGQVLAALGVLGCSREGAWLFLGRSGWLLGHSWRPRGRLGERLGALRGRLGVVWGLSWVVLGRLRTSWGDLGGSWGALGHLGGVRGVS